MLHCNLVRDHIYHVAGYNYYNYIAVTAVDYFKYVD